MVVIGLTPQVNTDAELTALTPLNDDIVYHNGDNSVYMYYSNHIVGEFIPDNGVGVWKKEDLVAFTLSDYKNYRYKEIDERTSSLISNGFVYNSKRFSLSQNAQINILGLDGSRNDPALSYPIEYSTIDDLDSYSVVDSVDLHTMYLAALGTKKYYVDSGTILKDSVRIAVNEQDVQLIIDNR